jgi:hypothetical protein
MFPDMATSPHAFPNVSADVVPSFAALVSLVESVPGELVIVEPRQYTGLIAGLACLRAMGAVFQSKGVPSALPLRVRGFNENPVALIRTAMAACPDEAVSPGTVELAFITDGALRENLRLEFSAVRHALANDEAKATTVLAGSLLEALLLWALQQRPTVELDSARTALGVAKKGEFKDPGPDLTSRSWSLYHYIEVSAHVKLIRQAPTAEQARLAKDYRDLIHPAATIRLKQECNRGTALGAVAAVEFVIRDLTKAATP